MESISIQIPTIPGEQEIEIDVRINGIVKKYNYRIEIFFWDDCKTPKDDKAACLKELLGKYDPQWELVQIGSPAEDFIPITFRKKKQQS